MARSGLVRRFVCFLSQLDSLAHVARLSPKFSFLPPRALDADALPGVFDAAGSSLDVGAPNASILS